MNLKDFLLVPIKQRIVGLKNEISLIEKQISITTASTPFKSLPQLCLDKNIKVALFDVYLKYYQVMDQTLSPTCQLKKFLSYHFYTVSSAEIQALLQVLYGHKAALLSFLNDSNQIGLATDNSKIDKLPLTKSSSFHSFSYIEEDPIEISLNYFVQVFPFEISVFLIQNTTFFSFFLRTMMNYNPNYHHQTVRLVSEKIRKLFIKNPISSKSIYAKDQHVLCFLLAEQFVSVYANKAMIQNTSITKIDNFQVIQQCSILVKNGLLNSTLNQSLIDGIHSSYGMPLSSASSNSMSSPMCTTSSGNDDSDDNVTLNSIAANSRSNSHHKLQMTAFPAPIEKVQSEPHFFDHMPMIEIEDLNNLVVPELRFAVYEIQKLSTQPSPSLMLFILSQTIDFINNLLAVEGSLIGADDTFPFFVYVIAHGKICNLPAIISFLLKYVDLTLRDSTRYGYDIQKLNTSYEFITTQQLPTQKFLILPFAKPPPAFKSLKPLSTTPIILKGVEMYASPLWNRYPTFSYDESKPQIPCPAFYRCTGSNEQSLGYLYDFTDIQLESLNFPNDCSIVLTTQGSLIHVNDNFIQNNMMIKVDGGDYEQSLDDIQLVSSMIILSSFNKEIKNPSTSKKQMIFDHFIKNLWMTQNDNIHQLRILIARVQMALAVLQVLPPCYQAEGNMDYETLTAIKYVMRSKKGQLNTLMHPKVFAYIENYSASRSLF